MKKLQFIYIIFAFGILFTSCKPKVDTPSNGFGWYEITDFKINRTNPNPSPIYLGDVVVFYSTENDADAYTVWPGENGFDYTKRFLNDTLKDDTVNVVGQKNQGKPLIKKNGEFALLPDGHMYQNVGTFMVYFTARNINTDDFSYEEVVDSAEITVVDTVCSLFPLPGFDPSKYAFNIWQPREVRGIQPEVNGTDITFTFPYGVDLSEMQIEMLAGNAIIEVDNGYIDETKSTPTWFGSLESTLNITVSSVGRSHVREYTVDVVYGDPSSENDLTELSIAGFDGEISGSGVDVELPEGIDLDAVALDFTVSEHATVSIGGTEVASGDDIDLSLGTVELTVTAQDGESKEVYTITIVPVTTQMDDIKFENLNPVVVGDISGNTVNFNVLSGTDLSKLIPTITATPEYAKFFYNNGESDVQIVSGETEIDFSSGPVDINVYTVADTVTYNVSVTEL